MSLFFLSFLLIFIGGIIPLFFQRYFKIMKKSAVLLIGSGSLLVSMQALWFLISGTMPAQSNYLFTLFFSLPLHFQINELALFFMAIIGFISALGSLYSFGYFTNPQKSLNVSVNYFFYSLLVLSMISVVLANGLISFSFSWELMSLSSFFLVIHDYRKSEVRKAGLTYFIFTHIGGLFMLVAFAIIYSYTGDFSFAVIKNIPENIKLLSFILLFIGFGSKAGLFPVHMWLPQAHPVAPSHVSALMSGVMIKVGIYGILKIWLLLQTSQIVIPYIVIIIGAISGVLGIIYALGQRHLKKLLAYSSVENIGIITVGLGIGMLGVTIDMSWMAVVGFAGALLHILNHAVFKSLLFLGAGAVIHRSGVSSIEKMGGLLKKMKITGATFLIASLAVSGLPPLNGFVGELLIYLGGFNGMSLAGFTYLIVLLAILSLVLIGGLALACFTKVVGIVFLGNARTKNAEEATEVAWTMWLPMVLLALSALVIGVLPGPFVNLILSVEKTFVTITPSLSVKILGLTNYLTTASLALFALIAVVALIRVFLYRRKKKGKTNTWGCGFSQPSSKIQYTGSSFAGDIVKLNQPFVKVKENNYLQKGVFPKKKSYKSQALDIAELFINSYVVRPVLGIAKKLKCIQHGDIHGYIAYIFGALVIFLLFM